MAQKTKLAKKAKTTPKATPKAKPKVKALKIPEIPVVMNFGSSVTHFATVVGFQVSGNGEMRMDFAQETPSEEVTERNVQTSVYVTMVTAKKMLNVMENVIGSYEETFGEIVVEPKK